MILVTGGTGFIGARLAARLAADGRRVRVLARGREPFSLADSVEFLRGDVTDADAVLRATEGADAVFHLAAYARAWARDERVFWKVNVDGTRNVVRACEEHGIDRLVHFSTALVDTGRRHLTAYQRSKAEAESVARSHAVIVRPTRVYGPGVMNQANSVTRLIDLYRRGRFRFRIADGGARGNYVFVDDVVDGATRAGATGTTGRVYHLGGEDATLERFLTAIASVTGKRRFVVPLPKGAVKGVVGVAELLSHLGVEPAITRGWVELLSTDWPVSSELARRELGYGPRGILDGIRQTIQWLEAGRPAHVPSPRRQWQSA